ncbi:porin [Saccharobesus litoralis]|uniref:Porin n=1 Tax=Saccharobesus litoralis TaxID=2172099 RepID=A0A2S0VWS7_9ALTE|nr:porin [Saccharobesus litoralis]AWB68669.1 porin [Saccharobesus litoralis]
MKAIKRTALGLAMAAALAPAAQADDKLSVSGFVDMSFVYTDNDGAASESVAGLDQAELNFGYDFGNKLTVTADVEYQNESEGVDLEQAFLTYALTDTFSVKAGRFLSYSGWETEEPTGLFQYSGTGYAKHFYGYYQQGVSGLYSGDGFAAAVSVVNSLAGPTDTEAGQVGVETMLAFMPSDDITIKGFYSVEGDNTYLNAWASYSMDALTLAFEYNTAEYADNSDGIGYLAMANYSFGDSGITVRFHDYEIEDAAGLTKEDGSAITLSPSYTVNDNLLMVFEYRMDSSDSMGDKDTIAIEALVTF